MKFLLLVFLGLLLVVLTLLVGPLLRRTRPAWPRLDFDVMVYRDQLAEVDLDRQRGVLDASQADAARTEIHRRLLAAEDAEPPPAEGPEASRVAVNRWMRLIAACIIVIAVPVGAFVLYGRLGAPTLPSAPFEARKDSPEFKASILVERLVEELKKHPEPKGYVLLGGSLRSLGRYDDSVEAFRQAVQLGAADAETLSSLGEAIVMANNGAVGPEARATFLQALKAEPRDPRSRFYLGQSKAQIGKGREAVAIWRDLEQESDPDAPWLPMLRKNIEETATQGKFDAASVPPQPPQQDGVAPLAAASPSAVRDKEQMIRSMVARLASKMEDNPNDMEGWLRLAKSYRVLGELDKARNAANRAVALDPKSVSAKMALADVQLTAATDPAHLPDEVVTTLRAVLDLEPGNSIALFYVGQGEAQVGHAAKARELWSKLLAQTPAEAPERSAIVKRIADLPK